VRPKPPRWTGAAGRAAAVEPPAAAVWDTARGGGMARLSKLVPVGRVPE
jgi:hypothetical protein